MRGPCALLFCLAFTGPVGDLIAADIDECRQLLLTGRYEQCVTTTSAAIEEGVYGESWHLVKAQAQMHLGRYSDAHDTVTLALQRYGWSVRLRWVGMKACRYLNQPEQVEAYVAEIAQLVQASPWRYTDAENLVALGEFILEQGADAKEAQDAFFTRAKRNNPLHRAPVIALGELALSKRDFQLAAEIFGPALEIHAQDPDILFGMARAFAESDWETAQQYLDQALIQNPHHAGAILFQVDRLIDAEQYAEADKLIDAVLQTNSTHPEALAYRSVLTLLQGDESDWTEIRDQALSTWSTNPLVDYTIGRKLSQKYRFQQGESFQRQALKFDPRYVPARKQLVQDLLRLGREEEGWKLAEEVYQSDPYDVAMYNLVTLREELDKFATIEANGFRIRMSSEEARIYGDRVVTLLTTARQQLTRKYQHELPETILVEIFPRPADFEVRTFGMPGIVGFLGVCFGDVITANSPASQNAAPVNFESVLWHEFAHVVTLNKTNNRMPRWLSEGISVYEERQHDPTWGEQMNVAYRQFILDGELSSIGDMSKMFLSPKSNLHVQFAYFQSSLIVEYIVDHFGFDVLVAILDDLAVGMSINESIPRHTLPMRQLDEQFAAHVHELAEQFGGAVDWTRPEISQVFTAEDFRKQAIDFKRAHPKNYLGLKALGQALAEADETELAVEFLEAAISLFPHDTGDDSPYLVLSELYRRQGDIEREQQLLVDFSERTDDAATTYLRLIELETEAENWQAVADYAKRLRAVKPLIAAPHAALAMAAERSGDAEIAVRALNSLLELNPADRADLFYRQAVQLTKLERIADARRSVLRALEQAPRYREALSLLLVINNRPTPPATDPTASEEERPISVELSEDD